MHEPRRGPLLSALRLMVGHLLTIIGALFLTLILFLVLPLMQSLTNSPVPDLELQTVNTVEPPPPPPPEEEPEEEEEEEPEEPPELMEEQQPLDLSQLELALNPGMSDGMFAGDFEVKLNTGAGAGQGVDSLFTMAELDQKPRAVYQPSPRVTPELQKRAPATVHIIFVVGQDGRVQEPMVQQSTNAAFDKAAMEAVRQWKFEPGKRGGKPVRFRMRVPITFPAGT